MAPTTLALCAGYGGLELAVGAVWPGAHVSGYVEWEAFSAALLLARMEDTSLEPAPIWCGDLAELPTAAFRGVDLVTAGFPCQPWSTAGLGRGTADERWIWPDIAELLRRVRPRAVFLENVPNLITGGGLRLVLADLAALGFDAEWHVFRAADVGAPHERLRVFILAHHRSRRRRSKVRDNAAGQPDTARRDDTVADSEGERRGEAGGLRAGPSLGPPGSSEAVADPDLAAGRSDTGDASRDPAERGRRARPAEGDDHDARTVRQDVADNDRPGLPVLGGLGSADLDGRRSADLVDAQGLGEREPDDQAGAIARGGESREGPGGGRSGLRDLVDASSEGLQGTGRTEQERRARFARAGFPPGPADRDAWGELLEYAPGAQPSLRREADGASHWLGTAYASVDDQLRTIGNGVVPQQAVGALRILAERLGVTW